ncbi:MAG: hypothetical protein IIC10_07600, partial [Proteobacteria bacterium]|nr:hypothetical protein [Pseudomonadota bacterium]
MGTGIKGQKTLSLKVAEFTVGYRKLLTLAACLFTLVLASGILRSSFDTSLGALLTRSDPYLEELDLLEAEFPSAVEINFAFIAIEDDSVFSKAVLDAIAELRDGYEAIPNAIRLTSLIDYYSPETRERLFDSPLADYSPEEFDALAAAAVNDRLLTAKLLSKDASLTFAIV